MGGDRLEAAKVLVTDAPFRPSASSDEQLLEEADRWEALGRLVDARRTAIAGEIEWRSREQLGDGGLARRNGYRNGAELLAQQTRIGLREGRRRITLGIRLRSRLSLQGDELPGRYPHVAAALQRGEIGQDAARVIVEALAAVFRRALPEDREAAERALTESDLITPPDLVQVQAAVWQARIDPDGAEPSDAIRQRARSFTLGTAGEDGMSRGVLILPVEEAAFVRSLLAAHRRGVQWKQRPCDDCEDDCEWHEAAADDRTKKQYDFDTVMSVLRAGARAERDGGGATAASPFEVVVHATARDLEQQHGAGWAEGVLARISIPAVERLQCSGGTRLLVTGDKGEPLYLGKRVRLFSRAQRRALAARDGGCAFPGCTAPVAWTEAHHIRWHGRDDGPTDIDNGVLLCSYHHHLIHATDDWEIRVHERAPHLVPKRWRGAPLRRHRMQRHPMHAVNDPPGAG